MACPRCEGSLLRKIIDKHAVDLCRDCGGVRLEHHKASDMLGSEKINTPAPSGKNPILETTLKLPKQAVRYLACPECNDIMNHHNFMHNSNVILDRRNTHGIWFDKYKLAAAMDFLHSRIDRPSTISIDPSNNSLPETTKENPSRYEHETFEIKDEDLQLLLEEFPEWAQDRKV